MNKLYYVAADKITPRIAEDVQPGYHVRVNGLKFESVSRRPIGKTIYKKLRSMDGETQMVIYN